MAHTYEYMQRRHTHTHTHTCVQSQMCVYAIPIVFFNAANKRKIVLSANQTDRDAFLPKASRASDSMQICFLHQSNSVYMENQKAMWMQIDRLCASKTGHRHGV